MCRPWKIKTTYQGVATHSLSTSELLCFAQPGSIYVIETMASLQCHYSHKTFFIWCSFRLFSAKQSFWVPHSKRTISKFATSCMYLSLYCILSCWLHQLSEIFDHSQQHFISNDFFPAQKFVLSQARAAVPNHLQRRRLAKLANVYIKYSKSQSI